MHYFYGPDTYGSRQAIADLAVKENASLRWIDRRDLEQKSLASWLDEGGSGLFGTSLLVVRDPGSMPKALQEQMQKTIKDSSSRTYVLWDRGVPDKRTALFRALKKEAVLFEVPEGPVLTRWLSEIVQKHNGKIAPEASAALVQRVGKDRWRLASEIEKLVLVSPEITVEAIMTYVVEGDSVTNIFSLLDAIAAKRQDTAMQLIESLLTEGESEIGILGMLAYQYRTMLIISEGLQTGKSQQEIAKEAKLHPFVVQKNTPVVRRYTYSQLQEILTKIMATDMAIKQGLVDARTGLTMLVVGLF